MITTKDLASAAYAGKPSAMGRSALASSSSSYVPIRMVGVAALTADQRKLTVPVTPSTAARPTAAPSPRRSIVRRERPAAGVRRSSRITRSDSGAMPSAGLDHAASDARPAVAARVRDLVVLVRVD